MIKTVSLVNAQEFQKQYPHIKLPQSNQIDGIGPEDQVRLRRAGEEFWVKVDEVNGCDYVGIIIDDPIFSQPFSKGDKINFKQINVFDIKSPIWFNPEHI
jgi:uncharacterized protein (DUF736 family)